MELIPAIDLRHGRAVRLRQGDEARATVYGDDPVAVLESWARAGVRARPRGGPRRRSGRAAAAGADRGGWPAAGARIQLGGGLRDREADRSGARRRGATAW